MTNNAGATISSLNGIYAIVGYADVTNSGHITGASGVAIHAGTNATVTNNAGASITGGFSGIFVQHGLCPCHQFRQHQGTTDAGIVAGTNATVTNNAGASITGGLYGISRLSTAPTSVVNAGTITGITDDGIAAFTNATVTNNAGASITGGQYGIVTNTGFANVTNSGSITGTSRERHLRRHQRDGDQQCRAPASLAASTELTPQGLCQCHQFRQHHRHQRTDSPAPTRR